MNCEWVRQNVTLYLYGELADDAQHELEQNVARCQTWGAERGPQEALEHEHPQRAWYQRLAFDPTAWLRQVRFSPALAMVIFMVGFGGGLGAMYQSMRHNPGIRPQDNITET